MRLALLLSALLVGCPAPGGSLDAAADRPDAFRADPDAGSDPIDAAPGSDASVPPGPDAGCLGVLCGADCCAADDRCFRDGCIDDRGVCEGGERCESDASCVDGVCVPWGHPALGDTDPSCETDGAFGGFEPVVQCEWPGAAAIARPEYTSIMSPPVIADLDRDGVPEIIVVAASGLGDGSPQLIRAVRGDDCRTVWTSSHPHADYQVIAVGDVNGDGRLEVCGRTPVGRPYCLRDDGSLLWEASVSVGQRPSGAPLLSVGVAMANVDGVGNPELVVGASVFDGATGAFRRGRELGPVGGNETFDGAGPYGPAPAIADIDSDGHMEALSGDGVFDLVDGTWAPYNPRIERFVGFTAVADVIPTSAGPEVVVHAMREEGFGRLRIHRADGSLAHRELIPGAAPRATWGGPPTVADLDGDGLVEIAIAAPHALMAFDPDCRSSPLRTGGSCAATDVEVGSMLLWSRPVSDASGGHTGVAVFDFEGDGMAEVVYADECWVRAFDGVSGEVRFSAPHTSGTVLEFPVVADADGDGESELVIVHTDRGGCDEVDPLMPSVRRDPARTFEGFTVLRDRLDRWATSRPMWSQFIEHFDDRTSDGRVPRVEVASWTTHNSYRQSLPAGGSPVRIDPIPLVDLTVGPIDAAPCDVDGRVQELAFAVCNRGLGPAAAGALVRITVGDSAEAGAPVCEATAGALEPGTCERLGCTWDGIPIEEPQTVWALVDPDGTVFECRDGDLASATVHCPPLTGPD